MNEQSPRRTPQGEAGEAGDAREAGSFAPAAPPARRRRLRRLLPPLISLLAVLALAWWGLDWYRHSLAFVAETNARIVADTMIVSARIAGWIDELPITEGSAIAKGQRLVHIDARNARLRLRELTAKRDAVQAEHDRLSAEIDMVDRWTRSRYASEESKLAAAKALHESLGVAFRFASDDFKRAESLSQRGVISTKDLDRTRTAYLQADQARLRAQAQVAQARAELDTAEADRQRIEVLRRERLLLRHRIDEINAQIDSAELMIADHGVPSPIDGVISRTFVAVGEYVTPGQRIAQLHNPNDIWVEALIKETAVGAIRLGQPARLHIDAYPDRIFEGEVIRIGHAATSTFRLLPNPNPSGNFTKVTQRIPVRVSLTQDNGLLRPGMMVEVSIDVRQR